MKNLFYIVIVLLGLTSCSSSPILVDENDLPEDILYLPGQARPFTGQCVVLYHGTSDVKEQMTFKKGLLEGETVCYYPNGEIKIRGEYKQGKLFGKWESWYEDGKKKYEVNYVNDTLNGNYMLWYSTGVLKEIGLYASNARFGSWIEYDEAGMIVKKLNFE